MAASTSSASTRTSSPAGGTGKDFCAGIERAVALGWLWRHESGAYVKFTDSGAALFA
jgi:hypothetical protein